MLILIRETTAIAITDGLLFEVKRATTEIIPDDGHYSRVRVTLGGELSRVTSRLRIDINVDGPTRPDPEQARVPRVPDGTLLIRGHRLEMLVAQKTVTALARGTAHTRWRDFLDLYVLIRRHPVDAQTLRISMPPVARYPSAPSPLKSTLTAFPEIAQSRWPKWLRKQRPNTAAPTKFATAVEVDISFFDS